ncbi:hypothetical protein SKAU_G00121790 [Synaphobranchus kaupii]|uniref:Uncharacterized protein n=1 Tax=Synaphobranchus kaupii TaxID=118154 RepID=A0A9Q1J2H0_SYNKA|nr:hypothetical protein SKAU_G00121790 [Synaphobranchus kaupii]
MKDVRFVRFMVFMMDFMDIVATLSKRLQQDNLLVTDVAHEISEATLKLLSLESSMGDKESKFAKNFNTDTNVLKHGKDSITLTSTTREAGDNMKQYKGASMTDSDTQHRKVNTVKLDLINNMLEQLQKRFPKEATNMVSDFAALGLHHKIPEELESYGNEEVDFLIETYGSC